MHDFDRMHRLLRLRRRLPAQFPRRRSIQGAEDPSAALARGPRLHGQESCRGRQRCHCSHAGPGAGQDRGTCHDLAALTLVHPFAAGFRQGLRIPGPRSSVELGLRHGSHAQHPDLARDLRGLPALAKAGAALSPGASPLARRQGRGHASLHTEVFAVGPAPMRSARCRPVRGTARG